MQMTSRYIVHISFILYIIYTMSVSVKDKDPMYRPVTLPPNFRVHVSVGDMLLHLKENTKLQIGVSVFVFCEDLVELIRML